ncbi:hypothetical protein DB41_KU00040 [Neochlamydia sp. TUME1]|nr:hypothetical protein DB41_KU00040 [Neochlamydia sp. TUME1]
MLIIRNIKFKSLYIDSLVPSGRGRLKLKGGQALKNKRRDASKVVKGLGVGVKASQL